MNYWLATCLQEVSNAQEMVLFIIKCCLFQGLKPQLVARLSKVLKAEETESNLNNEEDEDNDHEEEDASDVPTTAAPNDDGIGNGSAGGADIDMADIVVIDEYDSTKPEVKKSKEVSKNIYFQMVQSVPEEYH